MIDEIQLLQLSNSVSLTSSGNCCNGNNDAFDMVMIELLKSMAQTNNLNSVNPNIVGSTEINAEINKISNLDTLNSINNTNKIETDSKNQSTNERIDRAIAESSMKYGVDENLIRAVIKVESNFNPDAQSSAGAQGLMQIMPSNFAYYGVTDGFDIEQNIDAGTRILRDYLNRYDGDVEMALMAYNGGPTRMSQRGVKSIDDIYKMPKETQNYVSKVMQYYRGY